MPRTLRPLDSPRSLALTDDAAPLDLPAIFSRTAPLQVDLGCGDGSFLAELAERLPEQNFLGLERLFRRSSSACRRADRRSLGNVRVWRDEIDDRLGDRLGAGHVRCFHILFPDPWPKRRHHRRRLLQPSFLEVLHSCLEAGGEVRFRTDDRPYFQHATAMAEASTAFARVDWQVPDDYPKSAFQRRFEARGLPIYSLMLVKR